MPEPEASQTGAATNATTTNATTTEVVLGSDGTPFDPERAKATIENLRGFEKKAKELEKAIAERDRKLQEIEDGKLSEMEKLNRRLSELETEKITWERERQEHRVGGAVREAAAKAGAVYPDAVYKLLDSSTLEFDADGNPKNLEKVIEGLRGSYPAIFNGTGSADGGARRPAKTIDMNQMIRQAAGRT